MREANWYVIQVQTGHEQKMCRVIERVCAEADLATDEDCPMLQECFSPQYATERKFGGEWKRVKKPLLPGYVVAITSKPAAISQLLKSTPEFARLLSAGETFVPLRDDERAWMEEFTRKGDRVVPMSVGYREGDSIVVSSGPLKGREGIVTRLNRKKNLALLEMHVGAMTIKTRVGLAIVPDGKPDSGLRGGQI